MILSAITLCCRSSSVNGSGASDGSTLIEFEGGTDSVSVMVVAENKQQKLMHHSCHVFFKICIIILDHIGSQLLQQSYKMYFDKIEPEV